MPATFTERGLPCTTHRRVRALALVAACLLLATGCTLDPSAAAAQSFKKWYRNHPVTGLSVGQVTRAGEWPMGGTVEANLVLADPTPDRVRAAWAVCDYPAKQHVQMNYTLLAGRVTAHLDCRRTPDDLVLVWQWLGQHRALLKLDASSPRHLAATATTASALPDLIGPLLDTVSGAGHLFTKLRRITVTAGDQTVDLAVTVPVGQHREAWPSPRMRPALQATVDVLAGQPAQVVATTSGVVDVHVPVSDVEIAALQDQIVAAAPDAAGLVRVTGPLPDAAPSDAEEAAESGR